MGIRSLPSIGQQHAARVEQVAKGYYGASHEELVGAEHAGANAEDGEIEALGNVMRVKNEVVR